MSEHFPVAISKDDKNVLVPFSNGRIEVMQLSDQSDDLGRRVAYRVAEDGVSLITKAGSPRAYSDEVQEHYAHELAMDRNPTPEQLERGTPPKAVIDLGDTALQSTVAVPVAEVSSVHSGEQESQLETGMDIALVEGVVRNLKRLNESNRDLPELEGRRIVDGDIVKKATGAYDELKRDAISAESYSVMANTLLGAAGSRESIDEVVGMLMESETLDVDTKADLLAHADAIKEIAALTGMDGELAKIRLANSLSIRSEHLLKNNAHVATSRYRAMVGFSAGLSTQIKDPSFSSGFVQGALGQLKKHS